MKSMGITVSVDTYEPAEMKEKLKEKLGELGIKMLVKDLRGEGGDYIISTPSIEYHIERKTINDLFISLARNVYEHGEPKKEGKERRLFTQLLKLKGEKRVPVLIIEGPVPEDEVKRHTLIGVEEWCVRNGIFVIHTLTREDTVYAVARLCRKLLEESSMETPA